MFKEHFCSRIYVKLLQFRMLHDRYAFKATNITGFFTFVFISIGPELFD